MMKLSNIEKRNLTNFVYSSKLGISLYRNNYNFRIDIRKYNHTDNIYHIMVYNTLNEPQKLYSEYFIYIENSDELIDFLQQLDYDKIGSKGKLFYYDKNLKEWKEMPYSNM